MVYSEISNQNNRSQQMIDAIAWDLKRNNGLFYESSGEALAELLGLCPEQNVWMYEPDPSDPVSEIVFATFRLHASEGTTFHITCKLDPAGNILEWIGPHDISEIDTPTKKMVKRGMAA